MTKSNPRDIRTTRRELLLRADELAERVMHTTAFDAWDRLQSGQAEAFEGTLFESKLGQFIGLLAENERLPDAAE